MDKTKAAITIFNRYAEKYAAKYMDISAYHPALDHFCSLLTKETARLLDIACGPGNITKYILDHLPESDVLGIDLAPKMLDLARIYNPRANFQLLDGRDIDQLQGPYDGIICGFCLPYLTKEESIALIQSAAALLTTNGVLYLSTMEGDYHSSGWEGPSSGGEDRVFMHYHQEDYLTAALLANGFAILRVDHVPIPEAAGVAKTDLVMVAQKTD